MSALALALTLGSLLALPACGSAPQPSPSSGVERALKRGQALYDAHQYADAASTLLQALIEAEAEDDLFGQAVCYISLTLCQLRLGNGEVAVRMLAEADRLMPRLEAEQPNVEAPQLNLLFGRYHEAHAEVAKAAGDWRHAAEQLDAAERYYRAAHG